MAANRRDSGDPAFKMAQEHGNVTILVWRVELNTVGTVYEFGFELPLKKCLGWIQKDDT
jgi:hypothetical protein